MIRKAIGRGKSIAYVNGRKIAKSRGIRVVYIVGVLDGWKGETLLVRVTCTLDDEYIE
jgi:hypothetical protein